MSTFEVISELDRVETGEYNGIGSQMIALGDEVVSPDGFLKPERDNGLGWVSKYLGKSALDNAADIKFKLGSLTENGKIVDKRMLAWLLIGRDTNSELGSERFVFTADEIVTKALETTVEVSQMKVLQGGKKSATNWRSLFEGLVKADIFGKDFQPAIITSLGGYDGPVPLAAPFNILPGLELSQTLREQGYDPEMIVSSAVKYGVDCNGLSLNGASRNWATTLKTYQNLTGGFYPQAESTIAYETLLPSAIDSYPEELIETARASCEADENLKQTAQQYGADPEAFVKYMLSHTQAFRDFQTVPEAPFVIKVGAPSELRFTKWQKLVIEQALLKLNGFVPNTVIRNGNDNQYGQISLYYPRLGNRPPYYSDSDKEPVVGDDFPYSYEDFLWNIPDCDPSLKRYTDLQAALDLTSISPDEYLKLFSSGVEQ